MKIKVSEATTKQIDWLVAKCEGFDYEAYEHTRDKWSKGLHRPEHWQPSTDWAQGGPIIERENISAAFCSGDLGEARTYWIATAEMQAWEYGYGPYHEQDEERSLRICNYEVTKGTTPLVAAMRCYVMAKLGENVEIPAKL